jgi:hypothetical protein
MSTSLEESLSYPSRGDDALERFLLGAGPAALLGVLGVVLALISLIPLVGLVTLVIYPFLLIAQLAVLVVWLGYFVRVVQATLAGTTTPPPLDDAGRLLREGLYGLLVAILYAIPGLLVTVVGSVAFAVFYGGFASVTSGEAASSALSLTALALLAVGMLVVAALGFCYVYLFPIGLCCYAAEDSLGAAFDLSRLKAVAFEADYAVSWLVYTGVIAVIIVTITILNALLIGYLLSPLLPFVYFYLGIGSYYVFAGAYADAVGAPTTA